MEIPERDHRDTDHVLMKAGLSTMPIVGGPIAELFAFIIQPPLERRKQRWMEEVVAKLDELEAAGRIVKARLQDDDRFIDTFLAATAIAMRTSQEDKLASLRNAVVNSIESELDNAKPALFLSLVDRYAHWHIRVLASVSETPLEWAEFPGQTPGLVREPRRLVQRVGFSPRPIERIAGQLEARVPGFPRSIAALVWNDLMLDGLILVGEISKNDPQAGVDTHKATIGALGQEFLDFITAPNQSRSP